LQKTWTPFSNGLTFQDFFVIPAQAGIQYFQVVAENLDPVLQRADVPGLFRHSGAGRNPEVFEKTAPRHKTVSGGDEKG
jgi:hypothetical protein